MSGSTGIPGRTEAAWALDGRPGIAVAARVDGKTVGRRESGRAGAQRLLLVGLQQRGERRRQGHTGEAPDVREHLGRDRLSPELPDDRAQLLLDVEAKTVVDGVDPAVRAEQAVAALPVGVVGNEVEEADPLQRAAMRGILVQREVVLLEVGRNEKLERPFAVRSVALHRERHESPPERFGEVPGRQLALEKAAREVPQRPLATLRLVDGQRGRALQRDFDEKRGVGAPRHPALQRHLAAAEKLGRHRADRGQLVEESGEVLGEGPDLLLLALERDQRAFLARLEIKDALAGRADRAGGEMIGGHEIERCAHEPPSQPRSPSTEFTVSTTGPWRWYPIAVTEHGAIMMRWKRSRWMPSAWATAALIGSA